MFNRASTGIILPVLMIITMILSPVANVAQADGTEQSSESMTFIASNLELPQKGDSKLDSSLNQLVLNGSSGINDSLMYPLEFGTDGESVRVIIECQSGQSVFVTGLLESKGILIESAYQNLIQAKVPVGTLSELAREEQILDIRTPMVTKPAAITSQGVGLINADDWQGKGYTGAGVKIAVLDIGFTGYEALLGTELPGSVVVQSFFADFGINGITDHGTGCAEVIHDVAPDAELYLVNYGTEVEFALAVDWLITQDVDIISSSVGWLLGGPGDGTGFICEIVDDASASGILWVQNAGNEAQTHWQGTFIDMNENGFHDFQIGADESNAISVEAGDIIFAALKWDDDWGASGNDFDLLLADSGFNLVAASADVQDGNDDPVEMLAYQATYTGIYHIVIVTLDATQAVKFHLYTSHSPQYQSTSGSLLVPADAEPAFTVGAVSCNSPTALASYSSQGPAEDGRIKPDIVGPDGVQTMTYPNFTGTSVAAAHIAGAAALVKEQYGEFTDVTLKSFLMGRVKDLGAAGKDSRFGAGLLFFNDRPTFFISGNRRDAVISNDGRYLYYTCLDTSEKELHILDLISGSVKDIGFDYVPERVAISPDGRSVYVTLPIRSHNLCWFNPQQGYIGEIDTVTNELKRLCLINEDPFDIEVSVDGYVVVSAGSGQWDDIRVYNPHDMAETGSAMIRNLSLITISPDGKRVFSINTGEGGSTIFAHYEFDAGEITQLSYYHANTSHGYPVWGPDSDLIFINTGEVLNYWTKAVVGNLGVWVSIDFDQGQNIYTLKSDSGLIRKYDYFTQQVVATASVAGTGRNIFVVDDRVTTLTVLDSEQMVATTLSLNELISPFTAYTMSATNIRPDSSVVNGMLASLSDYDSAEAWFEWGTSEDALEQDTPKQTLTTEGGFSAYISGLSSDSTCYFRTAVNVEGITVYGETISFKTLTPWELKVATGAAEDVSLHTALLNGTLTDIADYDQAEVWFEWGTESGVLENSTSRQSVSGNGPVSNLIDGLSPNTTYYFRAAAFADGEYSYGSENSFTTIYLVSIDITPTDRSVIATDTIQFKALGKYSNGVQTDVTREVVWSSNDTSMVPIDAHSGLATGSIGGLVTISAELDGVVRTTSLLVLSCLNFDERQDIFLIPGEEILASAEQGIAQMLQGIPKTGFSSFSWVMDWYPEYCQVTAVIPSAEAIAAGWEISVGEPDNENGEVTISGWTDEPSTGNITLYYVGLLTTGQPGDSTAIICWVNNLADGNGERIPLGGYPGCVYIEGCGDVDGNGMINVNDLTGIVRMILGQDIKRSCADVNRDGCCNIFDLTKIARMILGLE